MLHSVRTPFGNEHDHKYDSQEASYVLSLCEFPEPHTISIRCEIYTIDQRDASGRLWTCSYRDGNVGVLACNGGSFGVAMNGIGEVE